MIDPVVSGKTEKLDRSASASAWHYVIVGLLAGVVMFWQLGKSAMDEHETKAAITAKAMLDPNLWLVAGALDGHYYELPPNTVFNHWTVPMENGLPRLVKTPLQYWLIAVAAGIAPGVTEFTARLPAAIAAVLTALVTLAFGRKFLTPRAALFGAVMLATSFGFHKWGRSARPEMVLCLFMAVSMVSFYLGLEARTRGRRVVWMCVFWLAMGFGNLAKEFVPLLVGWPLLAFLCWRQVDVDCRDGKSLPSLKKFLIVSAAGLIIYLVVENLGLLHSPAIESLGASNVVFAVMGVCIALPLVVYMIVSGGWKQIVPLLPTAVPGLVVMLAMFLPWFYYMGKLFPSVAEGIFSYQVSERAIGTGGWSPAVPWFYIMPMIVYLLPWLVFIPGAFAVPLMARFRDHRRPLVYLFLWTVGLVGLFTAAAGKREHYILPIYPAMCLLMGFLAEDAFFNHAWIKPSLARLIGVGYGLAAPASVIAIFMASKQRDQRLHLAVVLVIAAAPMLLAGLAALRNRLRPIVGLIAASITLVYVGFYYRADLWDQYATIKSFAKDTAVIIAQDARREGLNPDKVLVYHWGDPETQLPFYFGQFIPSVRWQFDRQQDQWVREGMDSKQAKDRIDQQWSQWIAEPSNAPWLVDSEKLYSDKSGTRRKPLHTGELQCLGYQVVMIRTEKARKSHQFTLYRRSGSTATIPASLPSIPEQDQQQE